MGPSRWPGPAALGPAVVGEGVEEGIARSVVGLPGGGQQGCHRSEEHEVFDGFLGEMMVQQISAQHLRGVSGVEAVRLHFID